MSRDVEYSMSRCWINVELTFKHCVSAGLSIQFMFFCVFFVIKSKFVDFYCKNFRTSNVRSLNIRLNMVNNELSLILADIQLTLVISNSFISNNGLSSKWKSCPCLNMKIKQVKNILEKRRNISPLFHNILDIALSSIVQLHINLLNVVVRIIFSSILKIWYVEVQISRSVSESPLEFEITRVDCIKMSVSI